MGLRAELVEGDNGVFDVAVGGDVVFSKQGEKGFIPTPAIVDLVRARLEAG